VEPPVHATSAVFHGVLEPTATPEPGSTYSFIYKQGPSCVGGTETTPGMVLASAQEVSEQVEGLHPSTEYTVCLSVKNAAAETAEASATFETATPPETDPPLTEKATAITDTTAELHGQPTPAVEAAVGYDFTYNTNGSCAGATTAPVPPAKLKAASKVSVPVTELEAGSEYTYCMVAFNEAGESATGTPATFDTPASKPVVPTESVSGVNPMDATLEGQVNPENQATRYHFEYSSVEAKLGTPEASSVGAGSYPGVGEVQAAGPVDLGGGLSPGTTYYYRIVASNGSGATDGTIESFTTESFEAPAIDEEHATGVTQTSAELHALINPDDQETKYQFKIGTDTSYGLGAVLVSEGELGASFGDNEVAVNLAPHEGIINTAIELQPNTEYHYEAVATNETGTSEGLTSPPGDQTFLTLPNPPAASTDGFSGVTTTTAAISGSVDPGASGFPAQDDTKYYFQYGTTTSYGHQVPGLLDHAEAEACREDHEKDEACPSESEAGEGEGARAEQSNLVGLEPGRTYHYRIVATNDNANPEALPPQTVYGQDETFTTAATPPILSEVSVQGIGQNGATITARLESQGLPTRWELQLGATPGLLALQASGNTTGTIPLSLGVGSLSPGTTYYYKLVAVNLNDTVEPVSAKGSFTTAPAPAGAAPGALPALIPYQSIAELNAKEAKEDKGLPGPVVTKPLTNAEKLKKALKACKQKKGAERAKCEASARKRYPASKQKKAKQ